MIKSTTPALIAHNRRTPVYHLQRLGHAACNKHLWCYLVTVEEAEGEGLRLCKLCERMLETPAWREINL